MKSEALNNKRLNDYTIKRERSEQTTSNKWQVTSDEQQVTRDKRQTIFYIFLIANCAFFC
jgi:hypothetical protein